MRKKAMIAVLTVSSFLAGTALPEEHVRTQSEYTKKKEKKKSIMRVGGGAAGGAVIGALAGGGKGAAIGGLAGGGAGYLYDRQKKKKERQGQ